MVAEYSVSPDGEKFYLPGPGDDEKEAKRLQALVRDQRALGREIVVVMGVEELDGLEKLIIIVCVVIV